MNIINLESEDFHPAGCKNRKKVIDDAYDYINNTIYLSTSSIIQPRRPKSNIFWK
jgi:hypothetical protein